MCTTFVWKVGATVEIYIHQSKNITFTSGSFSANTHAQISSASANLHVEWATRRTVKMSPRDAYFCVLFLRVLLSLLATPPHQPITRWHRGGVRTALYCKYKSAVVVVADAAAAPNDDDDDDAEADAAAEVCGC